MQYDIEKLIDILILLVKNKQQLSKLRITKLLYFIDKYHLRKYGRFVLNDRYYRLQYGPIPSLTLNLINEFFSPEIRFSGKKIERNPLKKYFFATKYRNYDMLKLKKEVNFNSLSDSELEIIDMVIQGFGKMPTSELVNISHKDKTWKEDSGSNEINPELFLDGLSGEKKEIIKKIMEIDLESDCMNAVLNK